MKNCFYLFPLIKLFCRTNENFRSNEKIFPSEKLANLHSFLITGRGKFLFSDCVRIPNAEQINHLASEEFFSFWN